MKSRIAGSSSQAAWRWGTMEQGSGRVDDARADVGSAATGALESMNELLRDQLNVKDEEIRQLQRMAPRDAATAECYEHGAGTAEQTHLGTERTITDADGSVEHGCNSRGSHGPGS